MTTVDQATFGRNVQLGLWRQVWPAAGLAVGALSASTPLTIAVPALAARWRAGAPLVFEVRDQWPLLPIRLGVLKNALLIGLARWLERIAYASARHVVVLSPDMG